MKENRVRGVQGSKARPACKVPRWVFAAVCAAALGACSSARSGAADTKPFGGGRWRIAWSADGNHNDPDDWIASPVALAIFAEAGVKDRVVHIDYNCILPQTNPEWEKIHAESVLGAAERYGFDRSVFHDCRKALEAAIASIAKAINDSTADNPLYFIIAGPIEVPYLGIDKSDPAKRRFVYCISHSRWNDGFGAKYRFTHSKRSVIEQDVNWVQIRDQNPLLSLSPYGKPAPPEAFAGYHWMRDSRDGKVKFLWERMLISTRPDPSDAGMAWFLVNGDEDCTPAKLKTLLEDHRMPGPAAVRNRVRLEAENFRHLVNFAVEDRNDRNASHRLQAAIAGGGKGSIRTRFNEPHAPAGGRCDVDIRYFDEKSSRAAFKLVINGDAKGVPWEAAGEGRGWTTQTVPNLEVRAGDEIQIEADGSSARLDYVQLNYRW